MADKEGKRDSLEKASDQPAEKKPRKETNDPKPGADAAKKDEKVFFCSLCKGPAFAGKEEIQDHISSVHGRWFTENWADYCTDKE